MIFIIIVLGQFFEFIVCDCHHPPISMVTLPLGIPRTTIFSFFPLSFIPLFFSKWLSQWKMKTYRLTSWARTWHYLPYQIAQYTCKWTSRYLWSVWRTSASFPISIDIIQCQICQFNLSLHFCKRLLGFFVLENTRKFKKENKTKKHWLFHQSEMTQVNILVYFLSVMITGNLFPLSPHCIWIIHCFYPSVKYLYKYFKGYNILLYMFHHPPNNNLTFYIRTTCSCFNTC